MTDEAATNGGTPSPSSTSNEASEKVGQDPVAGPRLQTLPIERIDSSQYQVREVFDENALRELARSMKQVGLLQPILVRPIGERFQIVAGERRLRAARLLGWASILALVQEQSEFDAAVKTMVENEQRVDANLLERARGYQRLIEAFKVSQDEIAERVGVSQSVVSRLLKVLDEPPEIQNLLVRGNITPAHARSLDEIKDESARVEAATQAAKEQWTVRETKQRARRAAKGGSSEHGSKETSDSKSSDSLWTVAVRHVFQVMRWIGLLRWLFNWLRAIAVRLIPSGENARVGNLPPPDPVEPPGSKPSNPKAA
jgi:ParB family chromosome partitioning protein